MASNIGFCWCYTSTWQQGWCYQPWDRLLALTCCVSCKSDNQIKRGLCLLEQQYWQTESVVTDHGLMWWTAFWLIHSHHYSCAPLCCIKGWCHHFLIDLTVLPHMALPCLVVFILPCSLVGMASWVSCLNLYLHSLLFPLVTSLFNTWAAFIGLKGSQL